MVVCLLVFAQLWRSSQTSGRRPTPTPTVTITPHLTPTPVITPTPNASLAQRIDTYIDHMTQTQHIGQLLILAVYTNGYTIHSQAQLNAIDFATFRALLSHQSGMIMVTHVMVPAYDASAPASLSPVLVDQVLCGQPGYQGVVITDAMDAAGLQKFMKQQGYKDPAQAIAEASVQAILAGDDIVECPIEPDRLSAVVTAVTNAVQSGRISQDRLRQSLRRIIALKVRMGLITLP